MKRASLFFTCSLSFFLLPKFFFKKVYFLCQNFGISKNCTIFVVQSNTKIINL